MQYYIEKKLGRKMAISAFILCTLSQLICSAAQYLRIYMMTVSSSELLVSIAAFGADFFGKISVLSSFAIIAYLVFIYGLDSGTGWLACEIVGIALMLGICSLVDSFVFDSLLLLFCASIIAALLNLRLRRQKKVYAVILTSAIPPLVSGIAMLYTLGNAAPTVDQLFESIFIFLQDKCLFILLITASATIALIFKNRAVERGSGMAEIGISGKLLPNGNPLLWALLFIDIMFFLYNIALSVITVYQMTISEIIYYGWISIAVNYFVIPVIYLVAGYVIMWLVALHFERLFVSADDENEIALQARKNSYRDKLQN